MGFLRLLAVVGALAGCGQDAPSPQALKVNPDLKSAAVEVRELELTYSAEALVEAVRQSTVSAQIAGRIVELRFDVGDAVKKGEVIARIDERAASRALEASEAQVREAQAALANARASYERSKQLLAQRFISQAALDQAESAYKAAQARVSALLAGAGAAATERSFATIVAPYSGVVSARPGRSCARSASAPPATSVRSRCSPGCAPASVSPSSRSRPAWPRRRTRWASPGASPGSSRTRSSRRCSRWSRFSPGSSWWR